MNPRIRTICAKLRQHHLDAAVIFSPANISYLTDYRSRDSVLFVSGRHKVYITDSRYTQEAKERLDSSISVHQRKDSFAQALAMLCADTGIRRLGFEEKHLCVSDYRLIRRCLGRRVSLVPVQGMVEELRQVKDADELKKIKKAVAIASSALTSIAEAIVPGKTELQIAAELERLIRYQGASMASFDIIVASGPNAAFPHHVTGSRKIQRGEPVLIDMGADYLGYKSDLTRVFFSGKITLLARRVYDIVRQAQQLAFAMIKPAVKASAVDAQARGYIAAHGYASFFGHNLGHGVGLETHEAPALSPKAATQLKPGMVITIEPGIYLPGKFGIRIEDMGVVTARGCDILSSRLIK
ncbi:MAG TPA: Xaa-Pro peptidase family protein [Patescibacteria group bacterium]|nr:Xaa-Pro peptidase family protein [Patescibacteria group bacterium]